MTVYAFYLYNRNGHCLLYRRWHQQPKSKRSIEHETKLMWGLLFSMKELVQKMTPRQLDENEQSPLASFTTHDSKVHYYETMTGLRFILTTDPNHSSNTNTNTLTNTQTTNTNQQIAGGGTTTLPATSTPSSSSIPASNLNSAVVVGSSSSVPVLRSVHDTLHLIYRLWVDLMLRNPLYRSSDDGSGAATATNQHIIIGMSKHHHHHHQHSGIGEGGVAVGTASLELECPVFVEKVTQLIEGLPYFH